MSLAACNRRLDLLGSANPSPWTELWHGGQQSAESLCQGGQQLAEKILNIIWQI